jgi:hypothetical protein
MIRSRMAAGKALLDERGPGKPVAARELSSAGGNQAKKYRSSAGWRRRGSVGPKAIPQKSA